MICETCNGKGWVSPDLSGILCDDCHKCGGSGEIPSPPQEPVSPAYTPSGTKEEQASEFAPDRVRPATEDFQEERAKEEAATFYTRNLPEGPGGAAAARIDFRGGWDARALYEEKAAMQAREGVIVGEAEERVAEAAVRFLRRVIERMTPRAREKVSAYIDDIAEAIRKESAALSPVAAEEGGEND